MKKFTLMALALVLSASGVYGSDAEILLRKAQLIDKRADAEATTLAGLQRELATLRTNFAKRAEIPAAEGRVRATEAALTAKKSQLATKEQEFTNATTEKASATAALPVLKQAVADLDVKLSEAELEVKKRIAANQAADKIKEAEVLFGLAKQALDQKRAERDEADRKSKKDLTALTMLVDGLRNDVTVALPQRVKEAQDAYNALTASIPPQKEVEDKEKEVQAQREIVVNLCAEAADQRLKAQSAKQLASIEQKLGNVVTKTDLENALAALRREMATDKRDVLGKVAEVKVTSDRIDGSVASIKTTVGNIDRKVGEVSEQLKELKRMLEGLERKLMELKLSKEDAELLANLLNQVKSLKEAQADPKLLQEVVTTLEEMKADLAKKVLPPGTYQQVVRVKLGPDCYRYENRPIEVK